MLPFHLPFLVGALLYEDFVSGYSSNECFYLLKVRHVLENCQEDMEFFNTWIEKGVIDRLTV